MVDAAAMGVDQVVRGDDLLASAPDQAWLAGLLGVAVPRYTQVPLAVNATGTRLAKRDGTVTLSEITARGVTVPGVIGLLARSLDLAAAGEPVTLPELLSRFDPERLPAAPWVVRPENITPVESRGPDLA